LNGGHCSGQLMNALVGGDVLLTKSIWWARRASSWEYSVLPDGFLTFDGGIKLMMVKLASNLTVD
jgi:hypothetical protein